MRGLFLLTLLITVPVFGWSACSGASPNYTAASASVADIQDCITSAMSGDFIKVPAGTVTWTTTLNVTAGKNLAIVGNGSTSTIITFNNGAANAIDLHATASRITNFGFNLSSAGSNIVVANGQNWRVDHNAFDCTVAGGTQYVVTSQGSTNAGLAHPTGVVDHNTFTDCASVFVNGDIDSVASGPGGTSIWQQASKVGAADQTGVVYSETNTFPDNKNVEAAQGNAGCRVVFRYNTLTNSGVGYHGYTANLRGCKSWETYHNTATFNMTTTHLVDFRGGSGVIWSNDVTSTVPQTDLAVIDNERSFEPTFTTPPGLCQGSPPTNSSVDGNQNYTAPAYMSTLGTQHGWPCRDQIGRGTDGVGTFPQAQASEPFYMWSNTLNGSAVTEASIACSSVNKTGDNCADIVNGRDYFFTAASPLPGYSPYSYPHTLTYCSVTFNQTDSLDGGGHCYAQLALTGGRIRLR